MAEVELDGVRSPEAQAIIDKELGVEPTEDVVEEDDSLPSDEGEESNDEPELYAGKYNSVDELRKGIVNIGSNLPEYVLNGMSPEALEQYYTELQKDFSSGNKDRKHIQQKDVQKETADDIAAKDANKDAKPIKIDEGLWNELDATFKDTGSITAEQYDKLNEAGIPDAMIDRYLDGIKAEQNAFTEKVYNIAGGQEQYNEIKAWAENGGISPQELAAISNMQDYGQILLAMEGVKVRYDRANGSESGTTMRGKPSSTKSGGYKSQGEYMSDVADPRYNTNPSYRAKVVAKLEKSNRDNW